MWGARRPPFTLQQVCAVGDCRPQAAQDAGECGPTQIRELSWNATKTMHAPFFSSSAMVRGSVFSV